jgi:hypothetical protein
MQEINDAYKSIRHAPLRYYVPGSPASRVKRRSRNIDPLNTDENVCKHAKAYSSAEANIRFAAGFAFGAIVFILILGGASNIPSYVVWMSAAVIPAISGFCSLRYGDEYWKYLIRLVIPY